MVGCDLVLCHSAQSDLVIYAIIIGCFDDMAAIPGIWCVTSEQ